MYHACMYVSIVYVNALLCKATEQIPPDVCVQRTGGEARSETMDK